MNWLLLGLLVAQNLNELPPDLTVPTVTVNAAPAAGLRVQVEAHQLYLPPDWKPGASMPLLVEYPGNGGYQNALGDVSDGKPEGCVLGYGLSGGEGCVWLTLPFVNADGTVALKWWGDVAATQRYCIKVVRETCEQWGCDPKRVVLLGFSRGAIACNYIGLGNDEIASLWCGMFCHSHYDGVREGWGYAGADRASALERLRRLGARPQWISHEGEVKHTQEYLLSTGVKGSWTFHALPFANHSGGWLLRDTPSRKLAREWLRGVGR
jgi:hypothetical protein